MAWVSKIKERFQKLLHNEKLKRKLYVIIFESDTRMGKLFDTCLIGFIIASVLIVILESMHWLGPEYTFALRVLEYIFTAFFSFEYLVRIYCAPQPKKYIFSFF
ncbi:MAG: ion transporter, partial [Parabacteroides sp.]|nr:ion transporter [Parabacteroides sp.]